MNVPSQTAVIHKSSEATFSLSPPLFVWVCAFDREKMLKVERKKEKKKRKEKKEREKNTQTQLPRFELALHRPLLVSSAWNFTTQPRKQNTSYVRLWISCHDYAVLSHSVITHVALCNKFLIDGRRTRVLIGVPSSQLTTVFSAKHQSTTIFWPILT